MGGNDYDRDVGSSSSSSDFSYGGTSSDSAKKAMGLDYVDPSTSPLNRIVQSDSQCPIVLALDVTGSNIEFARIVYDKMPMLYGQIQQQNYLKDFDICFTAVGDATCDDAPLQVCDFAKGIALDDQIKKIWLEGSGGSGDTESYELAAYYFANKCKISSAKTPFMFFIADEKPYATLEKSIIEEYIGDKVSQSQKSSQVFAELFDKFQGNVFMLHNPYGGSRSPNKNETRDVKETWQQMFGPDYAQHIIPIKEEKSVVDVILGTIAMVSGSRDINSYSKDLVKRGQSETRIENVKDSLRNLSTSIVPYVKANLPTTHKGKDKNSGAKRL
jgi:hypothetical protein